MSSRAKRMRPLLGTFVEVGCERAGHGSETAISAAFRSVEEAQRLLSAHDPLSELSRLNRGEEVRLHPITLRVLRLALTLTRVTGGLFDCTLGGTLVREGVLPAHGRPQPLERGAIDDVEIRGRSARLRRPLHLTLDGIAKGYAVDLAVDTLRAHGVADGWVNAGGDLRAFGDTALSLSVRGPDGGLHPLGRVRDLAVATSAVRARPDPRFPGRVVHSAAGALTPASFTVAARRAWRADALTKVACLAPRPEREILVNRLGGRILAVHEVGATS